MLTVSEQERSFLSSIHHRVWLKLGIRRISVKCRTVSGGLKWYWCVSGDMSVHTWTSCPVMWGPPDLRQALGLLPGSFVLSWLLSVGLSCTFMLKQLHVSLRIPWNLFFCFILSDFTCWLSFSGKVVSAERHTFPALMRVRVRGQSLNYVVFSSVFGSLASENHLSESLKQQVLI